MPNFTEALKKKSSDIEKPKPKPPGFYMGMIQGMPSVKNVKAQGEEKEVMSFTIRLLALIQVEDEEVLASLPEISAWPLMKHDFWEGEQGEFALKQFLTNTLEIDPGKPGHERTLGEMCADAAGKQLKVELINKPYTDQAGEMQIATNIKSTAKA